MHVISMGNGFSVSDFVRQEIQQDFHEEAEFEREGNTPNALIPAVFNPYLELVC